MNDKLIDILIKSIVTEYNKIVGSKDNYGIISAWFNAIDDKKVRIAINDTPYNVAKNVLSTFIAPAVADRLITISHNESFDIRKILIKELLTDAKMCNAIYREDQTALVSFSLFISQKYGGALCGGIECCSINDLFLRSLSLLYGQRLIFTTRLFNPDRQYYIEKHSVNSVIIGATDNESFAVRYMVDTPLTESFINRYIIPYFKGLPIEDDKVFVLK